MAKFTNRKQLITASDEEIEVFFSETVFEGIYSNEIKSGRTDFYKGSISNIRLEGRPTNLLREVLNVPISSKAIPEGPCSFKCRMNIEAFRNEPPKYSVNLIGGSLRSIPALSNSVINISKDESTEKDLFEMWGVDNCDFIGYYHYDEKDKVYVVDDMRKPNFDHIPYYPGDKEKKPIKIKFPKGIKFLKENEYYLFTWKLSHLNRYNPYEIIVDFDARVKDIIPKFFIDTLFDDRHNDKSKNFGSATNFLDTLSKQLSAKESTFVYELLQNANDYPVEGQMVDVEFHITDNYLLFMHTGAKFNVRNISGICGINEKEKTANKKTIGYKGIGFKTVFLKNHYVYIKTGKYSFRFDEGETPEKKVGGKIRRIGAPFQILPIWTSKKEVSPEVLQVFDDADSRFNVKIALRPEDRNTLHKGKDCYEILFREVFSDSNIILFIPNINSVRVIINGQEERVCYRNNEEWIVNDYEQAVDPNLQLLVNKTIDKGNSKIPEKYKDFDYTKVSFACKHKGAVIEPIEKATLYCYLPTSTSWGLPFLMNTDMIPKGDRDRIEKDVQLVGEDGINFNAELAAIAGNKLFKWIEDLLKSKNYQLGSVFSLVPDFRKCKREHDTYDDYIGRFEEEFDKCVEEGNIVPVSHGIANVNRVIYDTTGLSTSGIMTDEEFCVFIDHNDSYLPLPILRKDKYFISFLKRYADDNQKFDKEDLPKLISNSSFKEWLKVQDNNDKFLKFLLDNDYLSDLLEEEIFLNANGNLYPASELFDDIDKYLVDLQSFVGYLNYLSPKTREFFKDNEEWDETTKDAFAKFNCDDFVDDTLLSDENIDDTKETLRNEEVSKHFFKFLSENVGFVEKYLDLPFFNDNHDIIDDFNNKFIFFSDEEGHKVCSSKWLENFDLAFLSDDYTDKTKNYFCEHFGVKKFSNDIIINDIILSDDYREKVLEAINNDLEISYDFVSYCYENNELFESNSLSGYSLKVFDGDGDEQWYYNDNDVYFQSPNYDFYSAKKWINYDWLTALDEAYFEDCYSKDELKQFLNKAFGIEELTDKNFYQNIVKAHLEDILNNITGGSDGDGQKNIDFIRYLDDNYKLIFTEEKDGDIFTGLKLVTTDVADIALDADYLYIYDEELKGIIDNDWFPNDIVHLCHKDYGDSKAIAALGVKKYNFGEFYDDVIVEELEAINDSITTKDESISFHSFIIDHLGSLTDDQKGKMVNAKLYLYGNDDPSETSSGHKILSAKAKELCDKGLVEFSDLDIIDPDYKTEAKTQYWETTLGNTKFTVNNFFSWLKDNTDVFCDTLQDVKLNLEFWRWLKDNVSEKSLEDLPLLPILLKNGTIDDSSMTVYFSDEYLDRTGIEASVKHFDKDASFLSPKYIQEGDDVKEWKEFWIKMGIKHKIVDILTGSIIPNLSEIEDDGLPRLIATNREELEKYYENDLISHLSALKVKAHDEDFYTLNDAIYVDCEKEEPFPYIELPNQITFDSADERRLIKDIINNIGGKCVITLSEWQQKKLDSYLSMQDEENESIKEIHYKFINDLSALRNEGLDKLKDLEKIEKIKLYNRDDQLVDAADLTMGSVYKPYFDFEFCGITKLDYVSDTYRTECSEYVGRLFRKLNVHHDFQEDDDRFDDLSFLCDRKCALYFWEEYLQKKEASITRIKRLIKDKKFDNLACIPTKDLMKYPTELYYGSEVNRYVKAVEDWDNKVPAIKDIKLSEDSFLFDDLPFKKSLVFLDALYALIKISDQDRRSKLLKWMLEEYDSSYDDKIQEYREDEHAFWYNNNNANKQIKLLYALDYCDKTMEQYFGANNRIINRAYFPSGDSFKKACDMLCIKTITADDLEMEPVGDIIYTARNTIHKLYALVVAGMIDENNWKTLYDGYCEKLAIMVLHKCESILITYKEDKDINQSLKKFYHRDGENDFYFVSDLDGKRVYQSFVEEFMKFLNIKSDSIAEEMVEDIMDSQDNALEIIKEKNSLMLDEDFKDELEKLIPGIKRELYGREVEREDENTSTYIPTFTTIQQHEESGAEKDKNPDEATPTQGTTGISSNGQPTTNPPTPSINEGVRPAPSGTTSRSQSQNENSGGSSGEPHVTPRPTERTRGFTQSQGGKYRPYSDLGGWNDRDRGHVPLPPKPFSPEDVSQFGSHGKTRSLPVLEPTTSEISEINSLLGEDLTPEQVADQNYLAQLRLYNNLVHKGYQPDESKSDFIRNASLKNEHTLSGGNKYIHKCSAAGGIMYLSPSIWNKIADDRCVVCVYLGAKANDFMYFNSLEEILDWIGEDDIVIKLTGDEKADVVETLYSGVLNGVKGTAYTLIRINSNEKYNSVFAPLKNDDIEDTKEDENEYK